MEIFESLGLADRILALPHFKIRRIGAPGGADLADFGWLKTAYPFVTMIAQSVFLDWFANEAKHFSSLEIEMGANVRELIHDPGETIVGVNYRQGGEFHVVHAKLVVACDGRGSRMRKEAGLKPQLVTDLMEVL